MIKIVYKIDAQFKLAADQLESLVLLYQPLFVHPAMGLYLTLYEHAHAQGEIDVRQLQQALQLDTHQLTKHRQELEKFALLRTFEIEGVLHLIVMEPLRPEAFVSHTTFGRLYAIVMGNEQFVNQCTRYRVQSTIPSLDTEISAAFDIARLSTWDQTSEDSFNSNLAEKDVDAYRFDVQGFFRTLSPMVYPEVLRTATLLKTVQQAGTFYHMNYVDMKAKLIAATNFDTKTFDNRKFHILIDRDHGRQNIETVSNAYELDPVSFLAYKQDHDYIVDADRNLLKSLEKNFKFNHQVINALIEYVLTTNNMNLNKNYVEKIAATWQRKGVDTVEKAAKEIATPLSTNKSKQSNVKVEVKMPEYSKDDKIKGDVSEIDDEIAAMLKGGI
ncbi:DnaD domain protein [Erysipelothrix sp. HDW6C]|uniref:DnaD domain protein n=1 Tax=Erysipelothrix sp. HDW6C TaxID=2714930 RepID=UPI00140C888D|nr:DnaD domain protein [Erysipelothrix sp. HDW6C]QIK70207.1 DnaD domain protein [Erysipelothrix sp. HDW6C]